MISFVKKEKICQKYLCYLFSDKTTGMGVVQIFISETFPGFKNQRPESFRGHCSPPTPEQGWWELSSMGTLAVLLLETSNGRPLASPQLIFFSCFPGFWSIVLPFSKSYDPQSKMLLSVTSATTISTKNKLQHLHQVICTTDWIINMWPSESHSSRPGSSKAFQHVVNLTGYFSSPYRQSNWTHA